jgi:hypothetical protein
MMLQELYDRWTEIQKQKIQNQTAGSTQDCVAEELNILEALRICGCKAIPGETTNVQVLINDRHKKLEEVLRKRYG